MIYLVSGIVLLTVLLLGGILARLVIAGRAFGEARSVILHVSRERAWEAICDFPALHAAHTRGRPDLRIEKTAPLDADGKVGGSTWRQKGRWGGREYWADLQVTAWDPPRRLAVRLVGDSLGTERRLLSHRGELSLNDQGSATKLTWRLSARIGGVGLPLARLLRPGHIQARFLDISLRSVKQAIDGAREEQRTIRNAAAVEPFDLAAPGGRGANRRR